MRLQQSVIHRKLDSKFEVWGLEIHGLLLVLLFAAAMNPAFGQNPAGFCLVFVVPLLMAGFLFAVKRNRPPGFWGRFIRYRLDCGEYSANSRADTNNRGVWRFTIQSFEDKRPCWHFDGDVMVYDDGSLGLGFTLEPADIDCSWAEEINRISQNLERLISGMKKLTQNSIMTDFQPGGNVGWEFIPQKLVIRGGNLPPKTGNPGWEFAPENRQRYVGTEQGLAKLKKPFGQKTLVKRSLPT